MNLKYALLVGDGMADNPIRELDNKTPLQYAQTPNMDWIAQQGRSGKVATVPQGLPPGSDVANLALMGYDARKYYTGRAPLEAASMGVELSDHDTAFRCNLVTIQNDTMIDYSAGHIDTETARSIIKELCSKMQLGTSRLYPGIQYRHLLVIPDFPAGLDTTPPHDISGQKITQYLAKGPGHQTILDFQAQARTILSKSETNRKRVSIGKPPVTDIWLWGQGHSIRLPTLKQAFGLSGSVISAVDLVRGIGVLAGLTVRIVEGATGYLGTNYKGKIAAAQGALANEDFVYIHVEAPDETSHEGSLQKKIQAIEEFDREIVGEMLRFQKETGNLRILVTPDHATPIAIKTHTDQPIPYAMCGPEIEKAPVQSYNEYAVTQSPAITGPQLFELFIKG
ncbi:MAG TPA: cofactor-independent phosphoglycerate mutase [Chitinispirillaceae bacterium]|nr:cofactor-independent phosphoglycerate mutase [Chitinispirillaceae bacterium]